MEKTSVAGIAFDGDTVLIAHRNPTGAMGGRWEFPGGKVEADENDIQALTREFYEEFGIKIRVGIRIAEAVFTHNGEKVNLHAYRIYVPHKGLVFKYKLTEHTEYRWASLSAIQKLNFVDSDLLLYPDVRKYSLNKLD